LHASGNDIGLETFPEIGGYRLLRVLNHGAMSTVYLGEQPALSREVAIKVMMPQALTDEVSRRRFENEVRTIARLEHPNVVTIHEVGRTRDGLPYYAMPFLSRGHLGQRDFREEVTAGNEKRVNESRVLTIVRALLSALEYAHAHGIVHRDVKAENVLFDEVERPLLADFGIALRRGYGPRVTATGLAVGSTAYMAPEQARGEDVDGRADLYSLAVLMWEMLAGELPYRASDALSMAVMHAQDPIPKLPAGLRHWQRFMNRALAKSPAARFQDVGQMRAAIERLGKRRAWPGQAVMHRMSELLANHRLAVSVLAIALSTATAFAMFARNDPGEGFFSVAEKDAATATQYEDPTEAMLRPLPEAPLQVALENARRQIEQRNLTAPKGNNAFDSVLEAWQADAANPNVQSLVADLTGALTGELVRNLRAGRFQRARDYHERAVVLGQKTDSAHSPAQRERLKQVGSALQDSIEDATGRNDRKLAERIVAMAADFGLPAGEAARLAALARKTGSDVEATAEGDSAVGDGSSSIERRPVTVAEYAKFAQATQRKPALCRERASLLRMLAPRDYRDPGFEQTDNAPVVCVSMVDAEAYAQWFSQQSGRRYRIPTAAESSELAPEVSGRALSLWQRDCGRNCTQRQVRGPSWRADGERRQLQSSRGYDDVGFRLTREH
jgi:tRNA A-37 threonylcarbamoyl transferase component Bud32